MNDEKCPLCDQTLPQALSLKNLQTKLAQISAPMLREERERVEKEFETKKRKELEQEKEKRQGAELALKEMKSEFASKESQLRGQIEKEVKIQFAGELEQSKGKAKVLETRLKNMEAEKQASFDQGKRQGSQTEKLKLQSEIGKLQEQNLKLQRKLESQTGESRGWAAELDLLSELKRAFPSDEINSVAKGQKGADIVHRVIEGGQEMGKIIYESKNVAQWQKAFISKAKGYQRQYQTSYVILVSCAFPRNQKDFCVESGIPVVHPQFATALSRVMRAAVVQVGRMESSQSGKASKTNELYEYIIGNDFQSKFSSVAEVVRALEDCQSKERTWHESQWKRQETQYHLLEDFYRKVKTNLDQIVVSRKGSKIKLRVVSG